MSTSAEPKDANEDRREQYEPPRVIGLGDVVGQTLGDEGTEPEKKFMAGGFLGGGS